VAFYDHLVLFIGVDLAWNEAKPKETGLVVLEESGRVRAADWRLGIAAVADWIEEHAEDETLVFIDAPLVVTNPAGTQRTCEWHVGKCYGSAKVSANSTHIGQERLGGVTLRKELERRGFRYDDGLDGPPKEGRVVSECYPYTTIVGSAELDYNVRPRYKRRPKEMSVREFRPIRARECDELIRRVAGLAAAVPPLDLRSHEHTRLLLDVPSPVKDATAYKHREDLLDAALAAWTAALWWNKGLDGCQVLGDEPDVERPAATIIAPAKPEQLIAQRVTAAAVRERDARLAARAAARA
jgi:predicted RNase H-like nuclease